jgi:L-malate glycosyltransferase
MHILILTNQYPNQNDPYRNGFVHQRAINYILLNHSVEVLLLSKHKVNYEYQGIKVIQGSKEELSIRINDSPDAHIAIHFINKHIIKLLYFAKPINKITIFFHGVEALHWKRRLFEIGRGFTKYVIAISIHMFILKRFLGNYNNIQFIFVSNWMKDVAEKDLNFKFKNYRIIPNVINTEFFKPNIDKTSKEKQTILLIRHFGSRKYANDISVRALFKLLKTDKYKNTKVIIYGRGKYFKRLTKKLTKFNSVEINNTFLTHEEIQVLHSKSGIFLCPTRQDSQGVSMCEAMSSGLVPITSDNTGIKEYVSLKSGYLTDNTPETILESIIKLINNEKMFDEMSQSSRNEIVLKCSVKKTVEQELAYFESKN